MTIIVFLLDTSASMNQRAFFGGRPSLLDVGKGAVETFVKIRQRSQEARQDRYMLLTFEEPPFNIKAGWKENLATFMNELKNLQATGLTTMGSALKSAFDLLNVNRMQTGIDMYGQGRYPFYLEPAVIVCITDGGKLAYNGGVQDELNLPMNSTIPGSELTREPFRWDQRLFSLVLRLTGTPPSDRDGIGIVPSDNSPIDSMCEVTGGRSYAITSHRMLMQCVESLVQKIQSGVVIHFEKVGPDPTPLGNELKSDADLYMENEIKPYDNNSSSRPHTPTPINLNSAMSSAWQTCRKMILVPRSAQKGFAVGFWPIPEAFWPDINAPSLPSRSAHPLIKFTCTNQEPMVIENLPFDKYEVEPCPLTQFILSRKQATTCWQVFVPSSHKAGELGHPFGYLKASTNLQTVNLFVMPYNYPALLPLLDELFKILRLKPTVEWRQQFGSYLRTMPPYYAAPLRRALTRMGAPNLATSLIPETLDNSLSYSVVNYLKRLKNQAKTEFDKLCNDVGRVRPPSVEGMKVVPRFPLRRDLISNPKLQSKFSHLRDQVTDFPGFAIAMKDRDIRPQSFRNPYDIPRSTLLDQVARMRANFLQPSLTHTKLQDDDQLHSMPVAQMGNYQEYLKRIPPPLREIESTPVRQHMFGNPFKIDKRMMVDEADIDLMGGGSSPIRGVKRPADPLSPSGLRGSKRKPGPLPKDLVIRRPSSPLPVMVSPSPSPSPPPSPVPLLSGVYPVPVTATPSSPVAAIQPVALPEPPFMPPAVVPSPSPAFTPLPSSFALSSEEASRESLVPDYPLVNGDYVPVDSDAEDRLAQGLPRLPNGLALHREREANEGNFNGLAEQPGPRVNGNVICSKAELAEIQEHNASLRISIFKAIRRPGKDYKSLFADLGNVRGNAEIKVAFIQGVIDESLRFKRRVLAELVTQFLVSQGLVH